MLSVKNKDFWLNGEKFIIQSGAFHYFRALPEYWEDILTKIKAAGLNCVETYTCWNLHEPHKGQFDFSGRLDIVRFFSLAQKLGLKVILRVGPYICAEWENGGLPSWLLKREYNIRFRCYTEPYISHVRDWFKKLLPMVKPYLEENGGPIIAMAVENEYGSFGDDFEYLKEIERIYKEEGMNCLYIAADGNKKYHLCTGKSGNHIVQGLDFGWGVTKEAFEIIDEYNKENPYFTTEYWSGLFTNWGFSKCSTGSDRATKASMELFVDMGASFNIYMIYGGSNFGFTSGAQGKVSWMESSYSPVCTSYDYDAAITEWGGYTKRYFDIKEAMERDHGPSGVPLPPSPKLQYIGKVKLSEHALLFENGQIGKRCKSVTAESMEEYDQIGGYILYSKTFEYDSELNVVILEGLADRAQVFLNGKLVGVRMRGEDESPVELERDLTVGDRLDVLVENMGRIGYGEEAYLGDRKGITKAIILSNLKNGALRRPGKVAFNWEITCYEMDDTNMLSFEKGAPKGYPAFLKGHFSAVPGQSCFVRFDGLKKGLIFVNGFNLGRYWERGPLEALYLPGAILKEENEIVVFESDGLRSEAEVEITDICGIPGRHEEIKI